MIKLYLKTNNFHRMGLSVAWWLEANSPRNNRMTKGALITYKKKLNCSLSLLWTPKIHSCKMHQETLCQRANDPTWSWTLVSIWSQMKSTRLNSLPSCKVPYVNKALIMSKNRISMVQFGMSQDLHSYNKTHISLEKCIIMDIFFPIKALKWSLKNLTQQN